VTTYFDSSALVAVYVTERFSPRAREEVRRAGQIPWTGLHELEVRTTLRLLCGRRVIDAHAARLLASHLDEDVDSGRLLRIDVDYPAVCARSCELAQRYSARLLCRSLDVLHVACAHEIGCTHFVSGDHRQLGLARATGMKTLDVTAPLSRGRQRQKGA